MRPLDQPALRVLPFLLATAVVVSGCQWFGNGSTEDSYQQQPRTVYALGRLEPETGVIDIRATPGDRLKELDETIHENEPAPVDGILGTLDSYDMGKAQLIALVHKRELANQKHQHQQQLAAAQLAQAQATVAEVEAKQKELALQGGRLSVLGTASDLANFEYDRLAALKAADPNLVTEHQLEKKRNEMDLAAQDYEVAVGTHAAATEAADAAKRAADSALEVATIVDRQSQQAFETELVNQEIAVAREALKRSILLAPNYSNHALYEFIGIDRAGKPIDQTASDEQSDSSAAGATDRPTYTVLKILARRGEAVTQMPVMRLGNLSKMICIAEVYEADVKELFVGQEATIRSPAFSDEFADGKPDAQTKHRSGGIHGKVVHIGRMIAPPGLANRNPLAPADRSVVEVRIEINSDSTANAHAAEHVGLQVTVEFGKKSDGDDGDSAPQ